MRVHPSTRATLAALALAVPLAACYSKKRPADVPDTTAAAAIEAPLPEVRYYVIADT